MKKISLLFFFSMFFCQSKAQIDKEQQKLKNITLQAYESVSQATRQWFSDALDQHPAGDFDTAYAKRRLQEKYNPAQLANAGDLLIVMMAYQKMLDKEVRQDRKTKSFVKQLMLSSKAEKLKQDNQAIDKGMQEIKEKAEMAMNAATVSLATGVVSGSIQIAAASISAQNKQNTARKDSAKQKTSRKPVNQQSKLAKKLSLTHYINKLEGQLVILKKEKNE